MASIPDQGTGGFRVSQLLYDTRYRSTTIQIIALILILLGIGWLINNTIQNLDALGKEPSLKFFGEPASYDINQRLVEYSSRDTHLRASFVGLLNTLLVAVLGCITATIVGVFVGVLRLSNNWLIARLMTVYIEAFRNVPVLVWILIVFSVMIETMPKPSAFRNGEASMLFNESLAITNRGIYTPAPMFENGLGSIRIFGESSLRFDLSLTFLAIAALFGVCFFISRKIKQRADRIQNETGDRPTTWYLRLGVLVVPMAILLWVLGLGWNFPELKGFNFKEGIHLRNSLLALWIALSLYTAAFIAEAVRAGIMAISKGQTEAAYALGIQPGRTMSLVILPQALRVIIPPLISQYLNLTKNSSLAIAVGYMDITGTLGGITLNQTGRELETILFLMLTYLAISLSISAVMNWYNNRVKLVER
ncbi:MAG: ABC transporter permease subunit [Pseudomonadota bacterium]